MSALDIVDNSLPVTADVFYGRTLIKAFWGEKSVFLKRFSFWDVNTWHI